MKARCSCTAAARFRGSVLTTAVGARAGSTRGRADAVAGSLARLGGRGTSTAGFLVAAASLKVSSRAWLAAAGTDFSVVETEIGATTTRHVTLVGEYVDSWLFQKVDQ